MKLTQSNKYQHYTNMENIITEKLQKIGEGIAAYLAKFSTPSAEPQTQKVEFATAVDFADGTKGIADPGLQLGATIMVTTDEGTAPLADGTYQLSEPYEITVYEGKISNIKEIDSLDEKLSEFQKAMEARLSAVDKVAEFELKLNSQNELIAEQAKLINELHEIVTELSKKEPTREISKPNAATGEDRIEMMLQNLSQLKKQS